MADALLIADLAGRDDLTRVQQLYMKKQPSPYMRVVKAIQGNDFVSKFLAQQLNTVLFCKFLLIALTYNVLHLCFVKIQSKVAMLRHKLTQYAITWLHNGNNQESTGGSAFRDVVCDIEFALRWNPDMAVSQLSQARMRSHN